MSDEPAFMSWPLPVTREVRKGTSLLRTWQDGRCAACGGKASLVEDHDHETGLVRGMLCHGCNVSEGRGDGPMWRLWRGGMNPATVLDVRKVYESAFQTAEMPMTDEEFETALDDIAEAATRGMLPRTEPMTPSELMDEHKTLRWWSTGDRFCLECGTLPEGEQHCAPYLSAAAVTR